MEILIQIKVVTFREVIKNGQADCKKLYKNYKTSRQGHETCIFETPHTEMKCVSIRDAVKNVLADFVR